MIKNLLIIHVTAGIVLAMTSAATAPIRPLPNILGWPLAWFVSLAACQASLVGVWAGLGNTPWMVRLLGLLTATVYMGIEFAVGVQEFDVLVFFFVFLLAIVPATVFLMIRGQGTDLRRGNTAYAARGEGLTFGIRHLMALTFVVACLVTVGNWLVPFLPVTDSLITVSLYALCLASIAVTSVWAVLGLRHFVLRIVVVLLITVLAGWVAQYVIDGPAAADMFWMLVAHLEAIYLVLSLLVVRRLGYRLISKRSSGPATRVR
jgi:hypothetical protein